MEPAGPAGSLETEPGGLHQVDLFDDVDIQALLDSHLTPHSSPQGGSIPLSWLQTAAEATAPSGAAGHGAAQPGIVSMESPGMQSPWPSHQQQEDQRGQQHQQHQQQTPKRPVPRFDQQNDATSSAVSWHHRLQHQQPHHTYQPQLSPPPQSDPGIHIFGTSALGSQQHLQPLPSFGTADEYQSASTGNRTCPPQGGSGPADASGPHLHGSSGSRDSGSGTALNMGPTRHASLQGPLQGGLLSGAPTLHRAGLPAQAQALPALQPSPPQLQHSSSTGALPHHNSWCALASRNAALPCSSENFKKPLLHDCEPMNW